MFYEVCCLLLFLNVCCWCARNNVSIVWIFLDSFAISGGFDWIFPHCVMPANCQHYAKQIRFEHWLIEDYSSRNFKSGTSSSVTFMDFLLRLPSHCWNPKTRKSFISLLSSSSVKVINIRLRVTGIYTCYEFYDFISSSLLLRFLILFHIFNVHNLLHDSSTVLTAFKC